MWKAMLTRTTCIAIFVLACFARQATAASCEDLLKLDLPNTAITLAQPTAAGSPLATLPAFCRVAATLKPSSDSDIKIEVWLPAQGWNGKLQASGNGGWTGSIAPATLAGGVERGYASA